MSGNIDWVAVKSHKAQPIGAVGFIEDKVVAIISFHENADWDRDGKLSPMERLASKIPIFDGPNRSVVEVAMQALGDPDIRMRDPTIQQWAGGQLVAFASGLVVQAVYLVYFSRGVKMTGSAVAKSLTHDMVKQFVIRKGFEAAVKKAFMAGTGV